MAYVIPGTKRRSDLSKRFPKAIKYLEEQDHKPLLLKYVPEGFTVNEDAKGNYLAEGFTIGDIGYMATSTFAIVLCFDRSVSKVKGFKGSINTGNIALLELALTDPANIPKALMSKGLRELPKGDYLRANFWMQGDHLIKAILESLLEAS